MSEMAINTVLSIGASHPPLPGIMPCTILLYVGVDETLLMSVEPEVAHVGFYQWGET